MQNFTFRKLFQYYLPVTLTLFMLITIERTVVTDGGFDRLWGFPLPYITSSYAFTWVYDVFVLTLLFDLLFFLVVTMLFFALLQGLGLKLKMHTAFVLIGAFITISWVVLFVFNTKESNFYLKNRTEYKKTSSRLIIGLNHN